MINKRKYIIRRFSQLICTVKTKDETLNQHIFDIIMQFGAEITFYIKLLNNRRSYSITKDLASVSDI